MNNVRFLPLFQRMVQPVRNALVIFGLFLCMKLEIEQMLKTTGVLFDEVVDLAANI